MLDTGSRMVKTMFLATPRSKMPSVATFSLSPGKLFRLIHNGIVIQTAFMAVLNFFPRSSVCIRD